MATAKVSPKNRLVALLLCLFLGWAGAHRFYVNKIGTGVIMLLTMGGFGILYAIDLVTIAIGVYKDKDNLPVKQLTLATA